jgi:hypothetical protein
MSRGWTHARSGDDDFWQIFCRGVRQLAHAEVVDDEERHGGQFGKVPLPRAVERGVSEFFQRVRLAIEDALATFESVRSLPAAGSNRRFQPKLRASRQDHTTTPHGRSAAPASQRFSAGGGLLIAR